MKAHKYWSLGALACMAGCFYTGCKKLMQAHKYFACGSLVGTVKYYAQIHLQVWQNSVCTGQGNLPLIT